MERRRPYWKVAASLAFSLIATVLFILIGYKLLGYFMPFVIGWFIAYIAQPVVCWLEKRLKITKKFGSALIIILVLGLIVVGAYFGLSKLISEVGALIRNFPQLYEELEKGLSQVGESLQGIFTMLPHGIQSAWNTVINNLEQTMGEVLGKWSEPTMAAAGSIAKSIPSILIAAIVTVISAYFFIDQRDAVICWAKAVAPKPIQDRMTMIIDNLKYAVGGYFKAQFKIMAVVCVLLLVGFGVIGVNYAILLAILIAFLDFLPFFGTGTALIPWAVYKILVGNYKYAVGLLVLYGITQLVRQLIQPKLVGDSMGLNPLVTLILLYLGYKVGSVIGMILAVPVGMIVINLYDAGAFDYILDDVKILAKGIMNLRDEE